MILALLIYLSANTGLVVAQPIVVNALAAGALATDFNGHVNVQVEPK